VKEIDPGVRFGKPVMKGIRVPVNLIVGKLLGRMEVAEVMVEYHLKREDVLNTLSYTARLKSEDPVCQTWIRKH